MIKGAKIQISLNVYAQKCGSKQIHNLVPFSTSLPTSAEECQKFLISVPHFEIENVILPYKDPLWLHLHPYLHCITVKLWSGMYFSYA